MTSDTTKATPSEPSGSGEPNAPVPDGATISALVDDPRFVDLRRRFRVFVFPMTAAFLAWYLLYVVLSGYARDLMDTKVVGNINLALVFGVMQFASTFLIAWLYSRYASSRLDASAEELKKEIQ